MRYFLLSLLAILLTDPVYSYTGISVCNHGKETVSTVVCYGPTVLKETTVKGDIKITGSLQADNITADAVVVDGGMEITTADIRGSVNVTGDLNADHVKFHKGVAVTGEEIMLNHTTINGLMMISSTDKNPLLQVQCGSVIKGSVLFEGKAGVIQVSDDSQIQGKVINGSQEFVKRVCK